MVLRSLIALVVAMAAPLLWAEEGGRSVERGDYNIHYQVFNSTFLSPEVAGAYGVVRAENRAVVTVSVRKGVDAGGLGEAVKARVNGVHSDLIHTNELEFQEIEEREAVYYLAEFLHGGEETQRFRLEVQPAASSSPYVIEFSQKLYAGEGR